MIFAAITLMLATSPSLCRTVHGRMTAGNGTPTVRIWVVGTKRKLGVIGPDAEWPRLPGNVSRLWTGNRRSVFEGSIYGNFRVCAREQQRPGWMQMVKVVSARNLVLGPYR